MHKVEVALKFISFATVVVFNISSETQSFFVCLVIDMTLFCYCNVYDVVRGNQLSSQHHSMPQINNWNGKVKFASW